MSRRGGDDGQPPDPYAKGIGLLARREHSRRELADKLKARGAEPDAVEAAIGRLADRGYQDDRRFAGSLIRTRISAGHGPVRIRAELRQHGLEDAMIERELAAEAPDWEALALAQLQRRYRGAAGDPAERDRRLQFLLRRGFALETARAALATSARLGIG